MINLKKKIKQIKQLFKSNKTVTEKMKGLNMFLVPEL